MNGLRNGTRSPVERRALVGAIAAASTLFVVSIPTGAQEPPTFSGVNCSMTNCDCNCVAGEQQKAARAVEGLRVDLPPSLTQTPGRLSPEAAMSRLRKLGSNIGHVLALLQMAERDPVGSTTIAEIYAGLPRAASELGLPAPSAGWRWDERYLESLDNSIHSEQARILPLLERQAEIEKELNTCRQWADHKQCDPSLGVQGATSTPPREMPPAPPPVVTPPREMPPSEGQLPIGRHADGRPYLNDDLISRYVAASQAKFREGGAYWRQGRMGQADYAEISDRIREFQRYENGPEIYTRFDNAEIEVINRRRVEVTKAYFDNW
jgi:hypothetical protein